MGCRVQQKIRPRNRNLGRGSVLGLLGLALALVAAYDLTCAEADGTGRRGGWSANGVVASDLVCAKAGDTGGADRVVPVLEPLVGIFRISFITHRHFRMKFNV